MNQLIHLKVGILISKSISFNLISKESDAEGRFLSVKCEIFGERHTLINIYSPPLSNMKYLSSIRIIFAGDLNKIKKTRQY